VLFYQLMRGLDTVSWPFAEASVEDSPVILIRRSAPRPTNDCSRQIPSGGQIAVAVDEARLNGHILRLAEIGKTEDGGVTRRSLTPLYNQAEGLVADWMRQAGLTPRIDPAGNLIGRREGLQPGWPAIAMGSHFDTVLNGGMFDGLSEYWEPSR